MEEEEFLDLVRDFAQDREIFTAPSAGQALELAYSKTQKNNGIIICAGSLYLVGEMLALLERKDSDV